MMKRVLLAGVLGGIAMFVWSSIAHTASSLGTVGIKEIPNEQAVLSGMQAQLGTNSGLYAFPGMGLGPNPTRQEQNAAMQQYDQKLAANPSGILIYHPPGAKGLTPGRLLTEFLTELAEALLLALLLAQTSLATFASRIGFVTIAALMAAITTNLPYWNWYGFPTSYTTTYMSIEFVGYLVAGLVVAAVLKTKTLASRSFAVAA
jgi:heme exporter protein D